jgi:heat shock protein HslJ
MLKKFTIPLAALAIFLAACGGSPSGLTGVTWHLVSYGATPDETDALPDVPTSLVFNDDGTVGGSAGCNQFGGDYETAGDQITFGPLTSTLMACEQPIMDQESAVLATLSGTVSYSIDGNTLRITGEDGTVLVFDSTEIEL